ncbi:hypothetical protein T07_11292 [Trichinella nelsoni]|uniref:Uncharacterized protein n=1 Tax=Trichinella nelsoni TaxID=6336 RepID=A0A0V0RFU1_9BILA|nr:hypothetical protein T07_11292 [Trichinella nelsoni]
MKHRNNFLDAYAALLWISGTPEHSHDGVRVVSEVPVNVSPIQWLSNFWTVTYCLKREPGGLYCWKLFYSEPGGLYLSAGYGGLRRNDVKDGDRKTSCV